MATQLNIKDQAVVNAARALANTIGKSVTETIGEAIEEKRQRTAAEREKLLNEVKAILRETAEMWHPRTNGKTARQLVDELYDERGLPK